MGGILGGERISDFFSLSREQKLELSLPVVSGLRGSGTIHHRMDGTSEASKF